MVNGDNLTVCGNPYALLLYSVGEAFEKDPTLSQESYLINGKSVSKEEYEDHMAKLDSIYRSHIKSVMNDWVEFYYEMEQWRKLLDW